MNKTDTDSALIPEIRNLPWISYGVPVKIILDVVFVCDILVYMWSTYPRREETIHLETRSFPSIFVARHHSTDRRLRIRFNKPFNQFH